MPPTHTADFQTAALKATDLDAVEKVNVGLETELVKKHVNVIADAPEIRIQDKTGSAPEVNATTMSIVADGGTTHFRAGTTTFAEGTETKGNVKFQSSTGATTHAEIVGSSGKLELQDGGLGLKLGSNVSVSGTPSAVIQEIMGPHARESAVLKRYPEMKMGGLDNQTKAGVTVSSSSTAFNNTGFYNSNVYNQVIANEGWHTSGVPSSASGSAYTIGGVTGEWHKTEFPNKLRVQSFHIAARWGYSGNPGQAPEDLTILGSNDDSTWVSLKSVTGLTYTAYKYTPVHIDATEYYKYLAVVVTDTVDGTSACTIGEMYWMAREYVVAGDDSVDTTVKSVYNAPDLTSAALYIDAAKTGTSVTDQSGSTPSVTVTATGVTYDSTEKAWELTGAATSNIVSGDLASLVGDHPHSVSAWVKADQLNGDGLFHVGTAEGEGDAASRVGFLDDSHISYGGEDHFFSNAEWHNVTYTYNGEGSDKKLYLDGRLVDTAKNEDTFGDYPPFAMTNYSEYGDTVSASSEYSNYSVWEAFDDIYFTSGNSQYFSTSAIRYNTTTGAFLSGNVVAPYLTTVSGTVYNGEWIQMDFPHKLVLDSVEFYPHPSWYGRIPYNGVVAGSNDGGVSWEAIKVFSGFAVTATSWHSMILNSNKGYKSVRIVATAINSSGQNGYLGIDNTRFFGHRENDLVRFPDPTNVLKYPHVAMTGPAQRGYVASASSQYHDGNYPPYNAFNNVFTGSDPTHTWNSKASAYHTSSDGEYNGSDNFSTTISGTAYAGEWIQIELPRKVVASALKLGSYGSNSGRSPRAGAFAGSNDGSTWDLLKTYGGETSWTQGTLKSFAPNNNTTTAYKYFRFVITHVQATNDGLTALQAFEVHGTESGDVVARVGDGFDGKIRNLRVYSTALSDARVQEIFDADKDEFGLAKSSVSVYRGHLGVGTDKPKGALTVMDEVAELEEFPPRAMSNYETFMEGHGVFKASASHDSSNFPAYGAFTNSFGTAVQGLWFSNTYYDTTGLYTGTSQLSNETKMGEWLQLEFPYSVKIQTIKTYTQYNTVNNHPSDLTIYARNTEFDPWTNIYSYTNLVPTNYGSEPLILNIYSNTKYKYFAFVGTKRTTIDGYAGGISFGQIKFFGTREQGASTLHNGELSLTRNLTVPRIGPPLDADDTPRRDRLLVEYNTTTNPTENGVVKDTSGRGNDGQMVGATNYNSSTKGLVLSNPDPSPAASNYITRESLGNSEEGNFNHSVSLWFTMTTGPGSAYRAIFEIGPYPRSNGKDIALYVTNNSANFLGFASGGNTLMGGGDPDLTSTGRVYHIVIVYDGAKKYMYIDGVLNASDNYTTFDGVKNMTMRIGRNNHTNANEGIDGTISNFKMYVGHALTAGEVKRLYDMGRCDEGHHVVNFSKTRVGIGLGDGEAPQAALDVRGDIYGGCPVYFAATATSTTSADSVIIWDDVKEARGGGYDPSTGTFTVPIAGVYKFYYYIRQSGSAGTAAYARIQKNGSDISSGYGAVYLSTTRDQGSATALIKLTVGDTIRIYLRNFSTAAHYNSFVGEYFSSL